MTRFDADTPDGRRSLFAEGIHATRERGGPYVTFEAALEGGDEDPLESNPEPGDIEGDGDADAELPPWIQFADGEFNLDCTDEELDRLKTLVGEFPSFRIDELTTPEEAEGTNVRITARSDPNRLADFVETAFREVYGLPAGYRAWVTEI